MRYLGRELARAGMSVVGPKLPGHTSSPEALGQTQWRDWYGAVDEALDTLARDCEQVAVVGQSLGGLLALRVAQERGDDLTAIATLAAPLWLSPLARIAAALTRRLGLPAQLPKTGIDIRDKSMKARIPTYETIPSAALHSLIELANSVHERLDEIECPTLILHSKSDHTAPYQCSQVIASKISSEFIRHRAFEGSYHLLSLDYERNIVAAEVVAFFDHHFSRSETDEVRRLD
jgi:carboxylesterase